MSVSKKGLKGFQKTPEEEQKSKRIYVYLTEKEHEAFKEYCNVKNKSLSNDIRDYILKCIP